jgi:uncharacterized protein
MSFKSYVSHLLASNPDPLKNAGQQYALITGSSQGLGRAFAEEFARRGVNLVMVALPGEKLPQIAGAMETLFAVRADYFETDLTVPGSPEVLAEWLHAKGLPVSYLVNNAGVGYNSKFEDSTLRQNEACILLNNLALVKITRLLLPDLKRQPKAHILNVSSLSAFFPMPFMPVYGPSKSFILNFSLALRAELKGTPVQVSVLCPNGIRTNAECRQKIEAGGLAARLTCMDADEVADIALRGMENGRGVIVPGTLNQGIMVLGRFVPYEVVNAVVSAFWGKTASPEQSERPNILTTMVPNPAPESHGVL